MKVPLEPAKRVSKEHDSTQGDSFYTIFSVEVPLEPVGMVRAADLSSVFSGARKGVLAADIACITELSGNFGRFNFAFEAAEKSAKYVIRTSSSTGRCLWSLPGWCSCQDFGFETAKQSAKNVTRTSDFWRGQVNEALLSFQGHLSAENVTRTSDFWRGRVNEALLGCDWGGFQDHLSGAVSEDIKLYLQVSDCHIYLCGDSLYIAMTSH